MKAWIVCHLMITAVYTLIVVPKQRQLGVGKAIIALCIPFAGILLLLLTDLSMLFRKKDGFDYSLLLYHDDTEILSEYRKNDDDLLVPVSDALYTANAATKRKVVLNILKKEVGLYVRQLKEALGDDDTETSHYAAAALVEMKGEYDKKVECCLNRIHAQPDIAEHVHVLVSVLSEYISMEILDLISERKYSEILLAQAGSALDRFGSLPFVCYLDYAKTAQRMNSTQQKEILLEFIHLYPDCEEPYTLLMDYCYQNDDRKAIEDVMESLSRADVVLSQKTLELVRFYRNGEEYLEI